MRVRRVDENQVEIVKALRRMGASVTHIHTVGKGVSDLLVSFRQKWHVLEVKRDAKASLTFDEEKWIGLQRAPVFVVTSPMEAVRLMQSVKP